MKHKAERYGSIWVCAICKVRYACLEAQREILSKMGVKSGQAEQDDR